MTDTKKVHTWVGGMTQTGKTTYAVRAAKRLGQPVLFFDTKLDPMRLPGWVEVDMDYSWPVVRQQLNSVGAVRYRPDAKHMIDELEFLTDKLFEYARAGNSAVVVIDEISLLARNNQISGSCQRLATQGLGLGLTCFFLSQSAADTSKTILKQCERLILFRQDRIFEKKYWERLPDNVWTEIEAITADDYVFAEIFRGNVTSGKESL